MANERFTITVTTPAGGGVTVAPHGAVRPESGQTFDLFNQRNDAVSDDHLKAERTPPAAAPAETPAEPEKTPPAPAKAVPAAKKPWEDLSRGAKGSNFQPDPELYAKMIWCKENVPMMSILKLLRDGAEAECNRLISLHYRP